MVTYVLDASAILRYLDNEAGADRVATIIKAHVAGKAKAMVSTLHWGEIAGIVYKRHGADMKEKVMSRLDTFGLESVPVTPERAVDAATLMVQMHIPYTDALGVQLASDSNDHVLVTADFDVKPAESRVRIEFLPVK